MNEKRPNILILARWYPNRYDPMPGLFIRRQAEAVSAFCNVAVVYVHEDTEAKDCFEIEEKKEGPVRVIRVYYRPSQKNHPADVLSKVRNSFRFFKAYRRGFRPLKNFRPDLVHVHVLTRCGLVALYLKIVKGIPYLVSEHWSRYFRENGTYTGFLRKLMTRSVVKYASGIIAVSQRLKDAMLENKLWNRNYRIVPNTVDMELFRLPGTENRDAKKRVIHVSCFEDKSKNISGFLAVVKSLFNKRDDFEVLLVGEGPDLEYCKKIAGQMSLHPPDVIFTGLKEPPELSSILSSADFLVLSSKYETFGTVLIESMACGTPVVTTDVGIAPENISDENGIMVSANDPGELERGIDSMLNNCRSFNRSEIRKTVIQKFSDPVIAGQLSGIYNEILQRTKKGAC
jgi:glycosyltransferase involved in cell wall biosynthesis